MSFPKDIYLMHGQEGARLMLKTKVESMYLSKSWLIEAILPL